MDSHIFCRVTQNEINFSYDIQANILVSDISALAGGGYVVAVASNYTEDNNSELYFQTYDLNGVRQSNLIDANLDLFPVVGGNIKVEGLDDGGFLLSWVAENLDAGGVQLVGQRYSSSFEADGDAIILDNEMSVAEEDFDIISLNNGGFAVVTKEEPAEPTFFDNSATQVTFYDSGNQILNTTSVDTVLNSAPPYLSDSGPFDQVVTSLSGGGVVVVWAEDQFVDSGGRSSYRINAQILDDQGQKVGSVIEIDDSASKRSFILSSSSFVVTGLEDGSFVVAWEDTSSFSSFNQTVNVQKFSAAGVADPRVLSFDLDGSATTIGVDDLSLEATPDGGFVLSWMRKESSGAGGVANDEFYFQYFNADLFPIEDITRVHEPDNYYITTSLFVESSLAVLENGSIALSITDLAGDLGALLNTVFAVDDQTSGGFVATAEAEIFEDEFCGAVDFSAGDAVRVDLLNGTASGGFAEGDQLIGIQHLIGSDSDDQSQRDYIWGDGRSNILRGMAGNDILEGGGGADIIDGGAGWDYARYTRMEDSGIIVDFTKFTTSNYIVYSSEPTAETSDILIDIEAVVGTKFRDEFWGGLGNDYFRGESGDDSLRGDDGNDLLFGGAGYDFLDGSDGNDRLFGGDGHDLLTGGHGNDKLYGELGDDHLYVENGNNMLDGGLGSDDYEIYEKDGIDYFYEEGDDIDNVNFWGVTIDDFSLVGDSFIFQAGIKESHFNDLSLFENFEFNRLNYTLDELLALKAGGDDPVIVGTDGNDDFIGTADLNDYDGLEGVDHVDYSASALAVRVDLQNGEGSAGDAAGDSYVSIEKITGSDASSERDYIWGDASDNIILGLNGADILEGGAGADIIDGGAGWDYARYTRSDEAVEIDLQSGIHTGGDAAGDTLINIEAIVGSDYGDVLYGAATNDFLKGGDGDDVLYGRGGFDQLIGDAGADIFGFEGASAFDRYDVIRDFDVLEGDQLVLSDVLSGFDETLAAVDGYIAGFIEVTEQGGNSYLNVDADGGGDAFTRVAELRGTTGLDDAETLYNTNVIEVVA